MLRHLNDAVLRRYVDEPEALLSYEKEHLVQCMRCRRTFDGLRANARSATRALADAEEMVDLGAARAAILDRAQSMGDNMSLRTPVQHRRVGSLRSFSAIAAAVVTVLLFSYAPFRVYAQSLLTIFEPREVAPISLTQADLNQLHLMPELQELGTVRESAGDEMRQFTSLDAAQKFARQTFARPSYLPATIARTSPEYHVNPRRTISFTFDERKARASAARKHFTLPRPPAGVDGSTLTAEVGPIVMQSYGVQLGKLHGKREHQHGLPPNAVIVAQVPVSAVHSTSVSAGTIESYLLSLPIVPEDVKAQLRAIKDPESTVPIPVAVDKNSAQPVVIHGVRGLLIGDNTGVGSVVVWVSGGKVYSVAGSYSADEMTKVANSMTP